MIILFLIKTQQELMISQFLYKKLMIYIFLLPIIKQMVGKAIIITILLAAITHSELYILSDDNSTTFLKSRPYVFIQLYTEKHQYFKNAEKQLKILAQLAQGQSYVIAQANLSNNLKLQTRLNKKRYHAPYLLTENFQIQYIGPVKAQDIQRWIVQYFITRINVISQRQFKQIIGKETFVIIKGASEQQKKVLEIANFLDKAVDYFYLNGQEFSIKLYRHGKNEAVLDFNQELKFENLVQWTFSNTKAGLIHINNQISLKAVFQNDLKSSVFLLYKADDLTQYTFQRINKVCQQNLGRFTCGYVDKQTFLFNNTAKYFKLADPTVSALAWLQYGLKSGFLIPNFTNFSNQTINEVVEEIRAGRIKSFIEQAPKKKSQNVQQIKIQYQNVVKLTAQTYKSTIDSNRFVFVEYYSPTCGHCIQFAPQYQKLAAKVKDEGLSYVIAAVDISVNEEIKKQVDIKKFPTFKLFVNGLEIQYQNQRNIEEILKYLKRISTAKLTKRSKDQKIQRPYVGIYGITEISPLNVLPALFEKYPIYHIKGQAQFKIDLYQQQMYGTFSNKNYEIQDIVQWLEEMSEPLIIGIADEKNSKKLNQGINKGYPLLVIVQRDDSAKHVLKIFQQYCVARFQVVCGTVKKSDFDYQSFNKWLSYQKNDESVLTMIDTVQWKPYFFNGDLKKLNENSLQQFVDPIVSQMKKNAAKQQNQNMKKQQKIEKQAPKQKKNKKSKSLQPITEVHFDQL